MLYEKFAHLMEPEEVSEIRTRLSLMEEVKDVMGFYEKHSFDLKARLAVVEKLFELKSFGNVLIVLEGQSNNILSKNEYFKKFIAIINSNSEEIFEESDLNGIIRFLMILVKNSQYLYESFVACQTISTLVTFNKYFPSKELAKEYFQHISILLKKSYQFEAYLNCIHILNDLEPLSFSLSEFEFYKRCALFKNSRFPKDIFCGMKYREIDSIVINNLVKDDQYIPDASWNKFISRITNDNEIEMCSDVIENIDLISFLRKNEIFYEIKENKIILIKKPFEGFTTKIFGIAKLLEPKIEKEILENVKLEITSVKNKETEKQPLAQSNNVKTQLAPVIKFKNRFSTQNKILKVLNKYLSIDFEDKHWDERNSRKLESFEATNKLFEEEKACLKDNKDIIEHLFDELEKKKIEKLERIRLEQEEKRRKELELLQEQEEAQSWRNLQSKRIQENAQKPDIYVPRFNLDSIKSSFYSYNQSNNASLKSVESVYGSRDTAGSKTSTSQEIYSPINIIKNFRANSTPNLKDNSDSVDRNKSWEQQRKEKKSPN